MDTKTGIFTILLLLCFIAILFLSVILIAELIIARGLRLRIIRREEKANKSVDLIGLEESQIRLALWTLWRWDERELIARYIKWKLPILTIEKEIRPPWYKLWSSLKYENITRLLIEKAFNALLTLQDSKNNKNPPPFLQPNANELLEACFNVLFNICDALAFVKRENATASQFQKAMEIPHQRLHRLIAIAEKANEKLIKITTTDSDNALHPHMPRGNAIIEDGVKNHQFQRFIDEIHSWSDIAGELKNDLKTIE